MHIKLITKPSIMQNPELCTVQTMLSSCLIRKQLETEISLGIYWINLILFSKDSSVIQLQTVKCLPLRGFFDLTVLYQKAKGKIF